MGGNGRRGRLLDGDAAEAKGDGRLGGAKSGVVDYFDRWADGSSYGRHGVSD